MKFKLFRRSQSTCVHTPLPNTSSDYRGDGLDKSVTDIAVQLINGQGGSEFRGYFINLFRREPLFIKNVAPEYREALQRVLEHDSD